MLITSGALENARKATGIFEDILNDRDMEAVYGRAAAFISHNYSHDLSTHFIIIRNIKHEKTGKQPALKRRKQSRYIQRIL